GGQPAAAGQPGGAPAGPPAGGGQPAASAPAPAKRGYTAVAGPSCSDGTTDFQGHDADYGAGTAGWLKSGTGGYTGDGCAAGYVSEPMSGSSSTYDKSQGGLWHFDFSRQFGAASCRLSVYVPNNPDITYVGGNPTHYYVFGLAYDYSMAPTPIGQFDVSQVANRGRWVDGGSYTVTSGHLTLKMVNTGVDYTSSTSHAHHAASAVRLTCTSG
ncbi:hypothetical protein ACFW1A_25795, partial [Kitasatospora sp. NPDC058965]